MEWTTQTNDAQINHYSRCESSDEPTVKEAVKQTVEKAISYLYDNINDDSLYFLVEWDSTNSSLKIVVTDETKNNESQHHVCCDFFAENNNTGEKQTHTIDVSSIQYWARDILTTDTQYIRFSLVAIFSQGNRQHTQLL